MDHALDVILLVIIAGATAGIAARVGMSSPLVLTAVGLGLSYVPGAPNFHLEPEVVLLGFLPPLLYATAIRTPWVDLQQNKRAIGLLSIGLVLVSAFAVAGVLVLLLPDLPFAAALALGAVVAPPDAVAASAVARRVGMPRRVVTLLEGESLLNDATALVLLRTAIGALSASVSLVDVSTDFARAVLFGVAVGWALAFAVAQVRKLVSDPVLDSTLSLITPFVAYVAAEEAQGSGVLAVVVAGLILGHRSVRIQSAASRVTERNIWSTVQFLLESIVFLLIGLQLRDLLADALAASTSNVTVALVCGAVLLTVIVVRMAWVFPATYLPRLVPRIAREPRPHPANVGLVGWAGMRGVVTLAAVLTIPEDVPDRETLVLAAFTVVAGTLLLQGPTLPWLVRRLAVNTPDPAQDALQQAQVQLRAAKAGLHRLEELRTDDDQSAVVDSLHDWGKRVANAAWERLGAASERETPSATFARLRVAMLAAERAVAVELRDTGQVPHEIVGRVLDRLDQEEAMLAGFSEGSVERRGDQLVPDTGEQEACDHLARAPEVVTPLTEPDECPSCVAMGERSWVHLRMCLGCGQVGCCDSSPNRHASKHFLESAHPVMRSVELGESWRWCFEDLVLG